MFIKKKIISSEFLSSTPLRTLLFLLLVFTSAQATEIKDLNTSLIPDSCARFEQQIIHKPQALKILSAYLHLFHGKAQEAATIKAFTASALDQNFSYTVLYQMAVERGHYVQQAVAEQLYQKHEQRKSPSVLVQELNLLKLNRPEIISQIQQKLTIKKFRQQLIDEQLIGEAELRLYYSQNPQQFLRQKSIQLEAYQLRSALADKELKNIALLLRQGLDLELILSQKELTYQALKELTISSRIHQNTPFKSLLKAPLHSLRIITTPDATLLCRVIAIRPEKKLTFTEVEAKLSQAMKEKRVNLYLEKEIDLALQRADYKNFLNE